MEDKKMKKQNIYRVLMLVVLTATITFMFTILVIYNKVSDCYGEGYVSNDKEIKKSLDEKLNSFKVMLEEKYMGEINEENMVEGAIKGYVDGLGDPYTTYLTKDEMKEFMDETNSQYVGIGVYLRANLIDNSILVVGIMKDSPAGEAGMQAGDIITKIEDETYTADKMNEAVKNMKGKEGTKVKVTVIRDQKEIELEITRRKITVEHVASKMLEDNIAYIQIDSFDSGVAKAFKEQINKLKDEGAKKLILDLRSNGGGIVSEATEIADLFLEKNEPILITKAKKTEEEKTISKNSPIINDMPVVVLVNEGTASASEILAGALKDKYKDTTIVGKTTYGKGVIQVLYNLKDGSGLKITTEEYFTPNHNKINKEGIKPDIEIDLEKDEEGYYITSMDKDAQILKAKEILKNK